jgi:4-hydroxy-tetrahydrodipicolinate synthase
MKLEGSFVAIVTPFREDSVDREQLAELVNWHIEKGTAGIVPCGTTGEAATLSNSERSEVIQTVIETADGRVPVIAGTGTNNTKASIEFTRMAKDLGADAALLVAPYYNKPPQEGLYRHFTAIADAVNLPQVVYNVPGRTAVNIEPETVARLADHANIVAIKEASGDLDQMKKIRTLCDLTLLSGDDALTCDILSIGGTGVISVAANIIPAEVAELCSSRSRELQEKWNPLFHGMFIESNPIPVKAAMEKMGLIKDGTGRLPLSPISESADLELTKLLQSYSLLP